MVEFFRRCWVRTLTRTHDILTEGFSWFFSDIQGTFKDSNSNYTTTAPSISFPGDNSLTMLSFDHVHPDSTVTEPAMVEARLPVSQPNVITRLVFVMQTKSTLLCSGMWRRTLWYNVTDTWSNLSSQSLEDDGRSTTFLTIYLTIRRHITTQ